MSEVERLTIRAHDLSASVALWNSWYMFFVALTVVLAAGVFVTQFIASKKGTELSTIQNALIEEKDRIAAKDSSDKNGKIADANKAAGDANERAARAEERAGRANEAAAKANLHALKLDAQTEKLRSDNIALEFALSPRFIGEQSSIAKELARFGPIKYKIEAEPDLECHRLAGQIDAALRMAKWVPMPYTHSDDTFFPDGVSVRVDNLEEVPFPSAADALVAILNERKIEAIRMPIYAQRIPGVLLIRVGMHPDPVSQREDKQLMEERKKLLEKMQSGRPPSIKAN